MSDEHWNELERVAAPVRTAGVQQQGAALWLSLKGRIPRSTYWLKFVLPIMGLQFVAMIVDAANGYPEGVGPAYAIVALLMLWPSLVGAIKRLHDLGHSGWLIAVYGGGAFMSGALMAVTQPIIGGAAFLFLIPLLILFLIATWYGIKMMFFRGTYGINQFGPDPLGA